VYDSRQWELSYKYNHLAGENSVPGPYYPVLSIAFNPICSAERFNSLSCSELPSVVFYSHGAYNGHVLHALCYCKACSISHS